MDSDPTLLNGQDRPLLQRLLEVVQDEVEPAVDLVRSGMVKTEADHAGTLAHAQVGQLPEAQVRREKDSLLLSCLGHDVFIEHPDQALFREMDGIMALITQPLHRGLRNSHVGQKAHLIEREGMNLFIGQPGCIIQTGAKVAGL